MPPDLQNLNDQVAKIPVESGSEGSPKLPPRVALSSEMPDYENRSIVFTFLQYKHSQCEVAGLEKTEAKRLTEKLKEVNKIITKKLLFSGIDCKPVSKGGQYTCLFNELPADAELLEIDYTKAGRIFGYLVENIFNIVVIKRKHLR